MLALRPSTGVIKLLLVVTIAAASVGCSRPGVTFVDQGTAYDEVSVMAAARSVDTTRLAETPTAKAAALRHDALTELRSIGGRAIPVADLLTRTFSAQTRGVPVYVERATFKDKPAIVMVEAVGPASGKLVTRRVWVLNEDGAVLFVGGK